MSVLERKSISLILLLGLIKVNLSLISTANLPSVHTLGQATLVTENLLLFLVMLRE